MQPAQRHKGGRTGRGQEQPRDPTDHLLLFFALNHPTTSYPMCPTKGRGLVSASPPLWISVFLIPKVGRLDLACGFHMVFPKALESHKRTLGATGEEVPGDSNPKTPMPLLSEQMKSYLFCVGGALLLVAV